MEVFLVLQFHEVGVGGEEQAEALRRDTRVAQVQDGQVREPVGGWHSRYHDGDVVEAKVLDPDIGDPRRARVQLDELCAVFSDGLEGDVVHHAGIDVELGQVPELGEKLAVVVWWHVVVVHAVEAFQCAGTSGLQHPHGGVSAAVQLEDKVLDVRLNDEMQEVLLSRPRRVDGVRQLL